MKRRALIAAAVGMAAWPRAPFAQPEPVRRIGVLTGLAVDDPVAQRWMLAFRQGLQELGWTDGRNLRIEHRGAGGDLARLDRHAAELVALGPEVIVSNPTPSTAALRRVTRALPIVFVAGSDPLGSGFVESFARPGGNVTGFVNFVPTMGGKWLELLREVAPSLRRVAMVFNPETATRGEGGGIYRESIEAGAASLGLELIVSPIRDSADIDAVVASLAREPGGGIVVMPNLFALQHRKRIADIAAARRVPAVYAHRDFGAAGGLISYGVDPADLFRRVAGYVDRILKGAKPADLPVQQPTKFELVVNLKAARALGLSVPHALLALADEVIE